MSWQPCPCVTNQKNYLIFACCACAMLESIRLQYKHVKGPDHPTPFAMGTAEHDSTAGGMYLRGAAQTCASIVSTEGGSGQSDADADAPKTFMPAPAGWSAEKISVDLHLPDDINVYSTSAALGGSNFYSQNNQQSQQVPIPPVLLESDGSDAGFTSSAKHHHAKRAFSEADFALEYVPREEWGGRREGFVFRLGAQGMGYYRDSYGQQLAEHAAKVQNTSS